MNKLIAVDVDNVLTPTTATWLPAFCKDFGISATFEDIRDYRPDMFMGIDYDIVFDHLIAFCRQHASGFTPLHREIVKKLANDNTLVSLTDRQVNFQEITKAWLFHYKDAFSEIIHTPVVRMNKAEFCAQRKVDILIEDAPENIIGSAQNGTLVLMMDMPWNRRIKETEKIKRITCLSMVEQFL